MLLIPLLLSMVPLVRAGDACGLSGVALDPADLGRMDEAERLATQSQVEAWRQTTAATACPVDGGPPLVVTAGDAQVSLVRVGTTVTGSLTTKSGKQVKVTASIATTVWHCANHVPCHAATSTQQVREDTEKFGCTGWSSSGECN